MKDNILDDIIIDIMKSYAKEFSHFLNLIDFESRDNIAFIKTMGSIFTTDLALEFSKEDGDEYDKLASETMNSVLQDLGIEEDE